MASIPLQQPSAPNPPETLEERFQRLAANWRQAASSYPRNPVRYTHPAYQEIVRLGPAVVPFLLHALAEDHRHWFWALHLITGADPVSPEQQGSITQMTQAWLRWGREHSYLLESDAARLEDRPAHNNAEQHGEGSPAVAQPSGEGVEQPFLQLASIWQAETAHLSSSTAMANHPAYQEIIGLGAGAVPLLLREVARKPDHWFFALRALTGANPAGPADQGRLDRIAAAWLRWGRTNGYRW